jgi:HEPN domain-containing protein
MPAREASTPRPVTTAPRLPKKALKALLLALDQEPERTDSIERLVLALELSGLDTAPLRQLPLTSLQRMTTASRYPDGDEAPVDLFDGRDVALALEVARAVVGFADQQLGELDGPPGSRTT